MRKWRDEQGVMVELCVERSQAASYTGSAHFLKHSSPTHPRLLLTTCPWLVDYTKRVIGSVVLGGMLVAEY